jgi:RNA polymerase sigma factor (sigma-70 family)
MNRSLASHAPLVAAARVGDRGAIDDLLRVTRPDLMRFARRACATPEDAEDAVQAALWQLHRRIGTLRVIAAFASWLFRIVERECRRLLRLQVEARPLEGAALEQADSAAVPHELRRDLSRMIAGLPAGYREVLVMRDVEEMTAPEVAAALGISSEAVKSRLHRARGMLREELLSSGYWFAAGNNAAPAGAGRDVRP